MSTGFTLSRRTAGGFFAGVAVTCTVGAWAAEAETVQAQALPWLDVEGWEHGAARRTLLRPTRQRCETFVLRLAPGSDFAGFPFAVGGIEMLVVEGAVAINGREYPRQTFLQFAGPAAVERIGSTPGAAVIVMTSPAAATVPAVSTWDVSWSLAADFPWPLMPAKPRDPSAQPGRPVEPEAPSTFWKPLSDRDGRRTLLWASMPHQTDPDPRSLRVAGDAEILVLQGDLNAGEAGDWRPGAHVFLPRGATASAWSTTFGFLALVRLHTPDGIVRLDSKRRPRTPVIPARYPMWWS